jgi:hypothetical protein
MGWTQTHQYYAALREVEAELDRGGEIPWRTEWAELFGDPEGLVTAVVRRWRVLAEAQLADVFEPAGTSPEELAAAHPGLARIVEESAARRRTLALAGAA